MTARALVAVMLLAPSLALANAGGISGHSGKTGATCNDCHSGGSAPTVTIQGPTSLMVGDTGSYEVVVVTGASAKATGVDVATSSGTLGAGAGEHLDAGEVVHSTPLAPTGSPPTATFKFTLAATDPGTVTLFAAGLAGDGKDDTLGDLGATTTFTVAVQGPPDFAMPDLFGLDLPPPDLAPPPTDLATPEDLTTHPDFFGKAEPTWGCGCRAGGRPPGSGVAIVVAAGLVLLLLRRRRG